jgi:hypothetical protein
MTTMVKQTFMNGLHKEISYKIAEQPRLDLAPTIELATRIWNNSNQRSNQNLMLFPQQTAQQNESYSSKEEVPQTILKSNTRTKPSCHEMKEEWNSYLSEPHNKCRQEKERTIF